MNIIIMSKDKRILVSLILMTLTAIPSVLSSQVTTDWNPLQASGNLRITKSPTVIFDEDMIKEYSYEQYEKSYEGVDGDPYLFDDFVPSYLLDINNELIDIPVEVQVDLVADVLIFREFGDSETQTVDLLKLPGFVVNQNGEESYYRIFKSETGFDFAKTIYLGAKMSLYISRDYKMTRNQKSDVPGLVQNDMKFVKKERYLMQTNKYIEHFILKEKKFVEALPVAYRNAIDGIKKELKIKKIKSEKHLMKIVEYLDKKLAKKH